MRLFASNTKNPSDDAFVIQSGKLRKTMLGITEVPTVDHISEDLSLLNNEKIKSVEAHKDSYVRTIVTKMGMNGHIPAHRHPHHCVMEIKEGKVLDISTEKIYKKGDTVEYEAGREHELYSAMGATFVSYNTYKPSVSTEIKVSRKYKPALASILSVLPKLLLS